MQTNALATEDQIVRAIKAGGRDTSISLCSLRPCTQDSIDGQFEKSWDQTIKTMSIFTKCLPKESSIAALSCVLRRDNLRMLNG